jgi:hypothetical protein
MLHFWVFMFKYPPHPQEWGEIKCSAALKGWMRVWENLFFFLELLLTVYKDKDILHAFNILNSAINEHFE